MESPKIDRPYFGQLLWLGPEASRESCSQAPQAQSSSQKERAALRVSALADLAESQGCQAREALEALEASAGCEILEALESFEAFRPFSFCLALTPAGRFAGLHCYASCRAGSCPSS